MGTLVAIDAQNLYYSARRSGGKVDYRLLWNHIKSVEPESLVVLYLVRGGYDTSKFESLLRGMGYRVSHRDSFTVDTDSSTLMKYGSHDIRIALEASLKYVDRYEKFVLVSGDVDYSDLFPVLRDRGKETEFWTFSRQPCAAMLKVVDRVAFLHNDLLMEIR